ncbi:MAG: MFS transporter [Clostridia bacterium]|nr:MAG: MFS transporter [Clostridia bacterium]
MGGREHVAKDSGLRRNAFRFIVLMGLVSLFADMTYEGARSITGPYLSLLGASAAAVGFVGGLGELVGYGLRLLFGYLADRTRRYWLITIIGYGLNLLAVPLLALAGRWEVAALLIVAERLGKAIRAPSRDVMLSHASRQVGSGLGFGLHETLDQIGAVSGPLIVGAILYLRGGRYQPAFAVLFIPAILALLVLFVSRFLFPRPQDMETTRKEASLLPDSGKMPRVFWLYMAFTTASLAGFTHFQLISYHFKAQGIMPDAQIPILFAVAMGVDALVALPVGHLFDKKGLLTLSLLPLFTIPVPFLVFSHAYYLAILGVVCWGAAMGMQETIMRAAVAEIIPAERRGLAYGIFNTGYGAAWFVGSTAMGILYGVAIPYAIVLAVVLELCSLPLLFSVRRAVQAPQT